MTGFLMVAERVLTGCSQAHKPYIFASDVVSLIMVTSVVQDTLNAMFVDHANRASKSNTPSSLTSLDTETKDE